MICDHCGQEKDNIRKYKLTRNNSEHVKELCNECVDSLMGKGFVVEQLTPEKIKKDNHMWIIKIAVTLICVFLGVPLLISVMSTSARTSSKSTNVNSYQSQSSSQSSQSSQSKSSSSRSSSTTYSSDSELIKKQKRMVDEVEEELKKDKQLTFRKGYTFEQCVKTSHTYLKTKYSQDFYDTSVVVSSKDWTSGIYFVTGYTKSGKAFEVMINHNDSIWGVVTAYLQ